MLRTVGRNSMAAAAGEGGRWRQRAIAAKSSGGRRWRLREEGFISVRLRCPKGGRRKRQTAASDGRFGRPRQTAASDGCVRQRSRTGQSRKRRAVGEGNRITIVYDKTLLIISIFFNISYYRLAIVFTSCIAGTIVFHFANFLAVANGHNLPCTTYLGFRNFTLVDRTT